MGMCRVDLNDRIWDKRSETEILSIHIPTPQKPHHVQSYRNTSESQPVGFPVKPDKYNLPLVVTAKESVKLNEVVTGLRVVSFRGIEAAHAQR